MCLHNMQKCDKQRKSVSFHGACIDIVCICFLIYLSLLDNKLGDNLHVEIEFSELQNGWIQQCTDTISDTR